jgi:hypothetical protein
LDCLALLLGRDNEEFNKQLRNLGIRFVQASKLFAYEHLEKEVSILSYRSSIALSKRLHSRKKSHVATSASCGRRT